MGQLCCIEDQPQSSVNDYQTKQPKSNTNKQATHYSENSLNNQQSDVKPVDSREAETIKKKNSQESCPQKDNINKYEKQLENKSYLVLVGQSGVGKEAFVEQMKLLKIQTKYSRNSQDNEPKIKEGILGEEYVIVDTPSFQLDDDINNREQIIEEFQEYFEVPKYISSIGVIVNFERTDLMKKKVLSVLKYLRKFKEIISIIVVNMELSENEEEDKKHLRNSFKHMGCNQIIFINKNMEQEEILKEIKQINFIETNIDFKDTIFEKPDKIEEGIILEMLNAQIRHH